VKWTPLDPDRYPHGRARGREPYRTTLDWALHHASVRVCGWTGDGQGYAYLDKRTVSVPPPTDAESLIVGLHEVFHHALRGSALRRTTDQPASSWRREVDCWRAALGIYRAAELPRAYAAESEAVRCLKTHREAHRYTLGELRRLVRGVAEEPVRGPAGRARLAA
jgi:hypothetical protein